MTTPMTFEDVIRTLDLKPHPEGGWFRETWRSQAAMPDGRAVTVTVAPDTRQNYQVSLAAVPVTVHRCRP